MSSGTLSSPGQILLADHDPHTQAALRRLLEAAGYLVRCVDSGELALWSALQHAPDLIVLSIQLPGMRSVAVCRSLKLLPETASIPVIFVSASQPAQARAAGFAAGGVDFISQPYVAEAALARVNTHLNMARMAKTLLQRNARAAPSAAGPADSEHDILVVEDAPESLYLLASLLSQAGHRVREAPNGELALWSATRHPPDLVLLDIRMPGMNGLDVCRCLKADPATASVPVIFISAFTDAEQRSEGLAAGAVDFISKPFDPDTVLDRVHAHLRPAHASQTASHADAPLPAPDDRLRRLQDGLDASGAAVALLDEAGQVCYASAALRQRCPTGAGDGLAQWLPDLAPDFCARAGQASWQGRALLASLAGPQPCLLSLSALPAEDQPPAPVRAILVIGDDAPAMDLLEAIPPMPDDEPAFPCLPGLDMAIHDALARNEMQLVYQPLFHLASGQLAGAEALLRWHSAEHGCLLPGQFLGVAEDTGEIIAIGRWILATACAQITAWQQHWPGGLPAGFKVTVNLSSLQFWQDNLLDHIRQALACHQLPAGALQLDITASTLLEDLDQGMAILRRLQAMGLSLALDHHVDNSLTEGVLNRLPLDSLKLDPVLIGLMPISPASQHKVHAVVALARQRKRQTVACGIEQPWQLTLMQSCQCDLGQGYLLGAPVSPTTFFAEYGQGWHAAST